MPAVIVTVPVALKEAGKLNVVPALLTVRFWYPWFNKVTALSSVWPV